jgi:uroporphyrinogen-III synthase
MTLPLAGRTVLVTRPAHQAAALAQGIASAGGSAYLFPALAVAAVEAGRMTAALAQLVLADSVIFISPNAVQFGMAAIRAATGLPAGIKIYALGPGTARALATQGVSEVVMPDGFPLPNPLPQAGEGANDGLRPPKSIYDSEALLALPPLQAVAGTQVVIVRGVGGRTLLADTLGARGATVHYLECYRRVCPAADAAPLLARWQAGGIDAVTISSAETLHNLAALLGAAGAPLLAATPVFAPHAKIADTARQFGIARAIATPGGDAGLLAGLINYNWDTS